MSALLSHLLQHQPPEWDRDQNYNNKRYVRIELSSNSMEFKQIKQEFRYTSARHILKIERIQHPYAYFAFKIRQEHLKKLHQREPEESRLFYFVNGSIEDALEYNCDSRRSSFKRRYLSDDCEWVVVVKQLKHSGHDRDSETYPEYIIQLQGSSTSSVHSVVDYESVLQQLEQFRLFRA